MANSRASFGGSFSDDGAKFILRVTLGVLILFHGVAKVTGGIDFITDSVVKTGLPAGLAYLVYVGEVLAPLMLIFGVWTRVAALIVAINMVVALVLAHTGQLFSISKSGGYALELQAMYLFSALAIALMGAGGYSLGGARGRMN